ncbi:MAG: alanine racemase [Myxococcales bacterium]|nr:alanine racemase [Myxococcales bacterium]
MLAPLARLEAAIAPHRERLATPALIIDLDAVDHNVAAVIKRCGGDPSRWRPHVKTLKQAALLRHLFDRGVTHLKCATLDELAMVLEAADATDVDVDVLVAYPLYEAAFRSASRLADAHPRARVGFLADSPMHARSMDGWAHGGKRPLYFDVDIGMGRTGTFAPRWATHAAALAADLNHFTIAGLHGYDGHLTAAQAEAAAAGYDVLCDLAETMIAAGVAVGELVTSGSHTYAAALDHAGLRGGAWRHTISPGTIVLSDLRCGPAIADLGLEQAAFVATRVISADGFRRITADAGSKAIAPDVPAPSCEIVGWPSLHPLTPSEEHLPIRLGGLTAPPLGHLLWLAPGHVCTTVNLYRVALLIRDHAVVGESPIVSGHGMWLSPPQALAAE